MNRPDLTYLTQSTFVVKKLDHMIRVIDNKDVLVSSIICYDKDCGSDKYSMAIKKLPDLVQCAEMLFDMTKESSITHSIVSKLLNELKQD